MRIAETQCLQGNASLGKSSLQDFRCMLDVDAGKIPCLLEAQSADPKPNPALSRPCFEKMCWEIYLGYDDSETKPQLPSIRKLAREADRVEQACAAPPAK